MRHYIFIFILFFSQSLSAYHTKSNLSHLSLNALIKEVKQSHGDRRRQAMNALKQKLRTSNQKTRAKVIAALRQRFNTDKKHISTTIPRNTKQYPRTINKTLPSLPQSSPMPQVVPTTQPVKTLPPVKIPQHEAIPTVPRPQTPVKTPQPQFSPPRGGRP